MTAPAETVIVDAPARLHFGMLDLGATLGRRFGGIGAAVRPPSLVIEATRADALRTEGADADRALEYARRFAATHAIGGAHLVVRRALPSHAGLGSGTQLALAVGRALAELYALPTDAESLARAVGRSTRSAVGTWAFAFGGLVVEGGHREGESAPSPLLARHPMPASWRCVIAVPEGGPSVSGREEIEAFAALPAPSARDAERVAYLVLMALLPAVVERDVSRFGRALTEIQQINGRWFAPAQGGEFSRRSAALVRRMAEWGACGVGQSSWGPAVYGVVDGAEAAAALAERLRGEEGAGAVYESAFDDDGARVSREPR